MRNKPRATQKRGRNAPQKHVRYAYSNQMCNREKHGGKQKNNLVQQYRNGAICNNNQLCNRQKHGGKQQKKNRATTTKCATDRNMAESKKHLVQQHRNEAICIQQPNVQPTETWRKAKNQLVQHRNEAICNNNNQLCNRQKHGSCNTEMGRNAPQKNPKKSKKNHATQRKRVEMQNLCTGLERKFERLIGGTGRGTKGQRDTGRTRGQPRMELSCQSGEREMPPLPPPPPALWTGRGGP